MNTYHEDLITMYFVKPEIFQIFLTKLEELVYEKVLSKRKTITDNCRLIVGRIINNAVIKEFGREWTHRCYFRVKFLENNKIKILLHLKK